MDPAAQQWPEEAPWPEEGQSARTRRLNNELSALVRQRNLTACLAALAQGEKDKNVDGRSYSIAIAACGDAGDGVTALRLLRTAGSRGGKCSPGVEACTAAVKAVGAPDVDAAYALCEAMSRAATSHPPLDACGSLTDIAKPNARTLNTLLRACLSAGRPDVARKAFQAKWGIEPDSSSKAYAAAMHCAALDPEAARRILGDAADASSLVAVATAEALLGRPACLETAREAATLVGRQTRGLRDDSKRQASNETFRKHKDEEARREAASVAVASASRTAAALGRVLCCAQDGAVLTGVERRDALALRFGLDEALWAAACEGAPGDGRGAKKKRKEAVRATRDAVSTDARFDAPVDVKALVDKATKVVVELGCGSGEWCAARASQDSTTAFLAVESRCDRAATVIKHAVLQNLPNLCVAHGGATPVLSALTPGSVAAVHVNFPEPPSQTCVDTDMPHMLGEECFHAAALALKPGGRFVIVSDNEAFAKYLAAEVHPAFSTVPLPQYSVVQPGLYKGAPSEDVGWPSQGDSYFDRLWRRGVSKHSAAVDRYILCLARTDAVVAPPPTEKRPRDAADDVAPAKRKKRKSSKALRKKNKRKGLQGKGE